MTPDPVERPDPPAPAGRRRAAVTLGAVLVAGELARPQVLGAPFFADDWIFLDQARQRSLLHTLTSLDPIGNFVRPLGRQAWFWVVGRLGSESPVVFHAASIAVFLTGVALLFALTRRFAGTVAAATAASFLALHYAADVPLIWACGSQDLLATTFAIGAILAFTRGGRFLAAGLLLAAMLAKEAVVLAPLPALLLARRRGESWRTTIVRGWPFALTWLAWVGLAAVTAARGSFHGAGLGFTLDHPLAALVNMVRTVVGLEWRTGSFPWLQLNVPEGWTLVAMGLTAIAIGWLAGEPRAGARPEKHAASAVTRPANPGRASAAAARAKSEAARGGAPSAEMPVFWAGVVWAVAGALPVLLVAPIWSAYYYLFAMAGAGLALGAVLARRPALAAVVVTLLAFTGHQARSLDEFQTGRTAWSGQSHLNGLYLRRGMTIVSSGLQDLKAIHPTLPPSSTVFFAGLPPFASFQVGDGPLVRGAYRDTSLRGYYLSDFTEERSRRGPCYFIFYERAQGHLVDQGNDPQMLLRIALGQLLSDHPRVAGAALRMQIERYPKEIAGLYWAGLNALELGQSARADTLLAGAGLDHRGSGKALVDAALATMAAGDTTGAARMAVAARDHHVRDPEVHALLADLYLRYKETIALGVMESYAAKVLAPNWAPAWRRWALCQVQSDRQLEAARSLDHYFELDPSARQKDPGAVAMREQLRRVLPGGDLAQAALRKAAKEPPRP